MLEWIKGLLAPKAQPKEESIYATAARRYESELLKEEE